MTAPFDPAVASLIRATHAQHVSAVAVTDLGILELAVEDYRVSWDEDRAPRVLAELTVPATMTAAQFEALDPRKLVRVRVSATYRLLDGTENTRQVAELYLRSRHVDRPGDTVTLVAASLEALYIDAAPNPYDGLGGTLVYTDAVAYIRNLLDAFAGTPPLTAGGAGLVSTIPAWGLPTYEGEQSPGDLWDAMVTAADSLDADLYDVGDGKLRLAPRSYVVAASALAVSSGPAGILTRSRAGLDREAWANTVHARFSWDDATTGDARVQVGTAQVTSGPFRPAVAGGRTLIENRDGFASAATATAVAAGILRRSLARARSYTLTTVSAWWVRAGHTVTVQLPTGDQERHLVSTVEHSTGGAMTITTRLPDDESTIGE